MSVTLTDEQWEELGLAIDSLENFTTSLTVMTFILDKVHVDALRRGLPDVLSRMQAVVAQVDGEED